jgi:hypothetical protein
MIVPLVGLPHRRSAWCCIGNLWAAALIEDGHCLNEGVDNFSNIETKGILMGHGDHWEAVEKDYSTFTAEMLPLICQKGKLIGENAFTHHIDDIPNKAGRVFGLRYLDSPLNFLALVVSGIEEGSNQLWSAYPVCAEGMKSRLVIDAVKAWDNAGIEGIIEASVPDGGMITFFDPYYFLNKDGYHLGEEVTVALGALAYTLQKAEQLEIEVHEGEMLEIHRKNLLEQDPTIDVSAITSVPISLDGTSIYFPRGEDDAELRFKVEQISPFKCAERSVMQITGTIMKPESGDVKINVYASEQVLNGYVPQIGDNVEAVVWMQGYRVKQDGK